MQGSRPEVELPGLSAETAACGHGLGDVGLQFALAPI